MNMLGPTESRRPGGVVLVLIAAVTAAKAAIAWRIEPSTLEAYYWHYGQHPALGYGDHPAAVGWSIRLSTTLFGHGLLGLRVVFLLMGGLSIWLTFLCGRRLFGPREGMLAALLVSVTPMFVVYGARATPDAPLLLCWTATLWALSQVFSGGRPAWWLAAGFFLGLAMNSKYSAVFLPVGVLGLLACSPDLRFWLRRKEPYLAVAVALACFSPTLVWNSMNEWRSLRYQGLERFSEGGPGAWKEAYKYPLEQMALATPLLAIGIWTATWRMAVGWNRASPAARFSVAMAMPALLFFTPLVFVRSVIAHWTAPAYVGAALVVAAIAHRGSSIWRKACCATLAGFGGLLALGAVGAVALPRHWFDGWRRFAGEVRRLDADFVIASDYRVAGELGFFLHPIPAYDASAVGRQGGAFPAWWNPDRHEAQDAVIVHYAGRVPREFERLREVFDRIEDPVELTATRWGARRVSFVARRAVGYRARAGP